MIIPNAEPFYFPGNRTGCLLVHGFTGSPTEMRPLGAFLAEQGYTVLGVRLMGHATRPEDLTRARWQDWLASAEDGWHLLWGSVERAFVMGLSMGGLLSLILAAQFPVAGVVAMGTPYALPDDPRLRFVRLLALFKPLYPKEPSEPRDPEPYRSHVCYPVYVTRAVLEVRALITHMRAALPKIKAPTLLMQGREDGSVSPDSMPAIHAALGSKDKTMLWVENSGHVVTLEPSRQMVYQAAADFVRRVSGEGA